MSTELEGIQLLEDLTPEQLEPEPQNLLYSYLDFDVIEEFNTMEEEEKEIRSVEELQGLDKMYEFVNLNPSYETLNSYANKCLSYVASNDTEFSKVTQRASEVRAKHIAVDDDDFI